VVLLCDRECRLVRCCGSSWMKLVASSLDFLPFTSIFSRRFWISRRLLFTALDLEWVSTLLPRYVSHFLLSARAASTQLYSLIAQVASRSSSSWGTASYCIGLSELTSSRSYRFRPPHSPLSSSPPFPAQRSTSRHWIRHHMRASRWMW